MKENDVLEIFGNNSKYFLNFFLLKMQTSNIWKTDKREDVSSLYFAAFQRFNVIYIGKNIDLQKTGLMHLKPGSKSHITVTWK